MRTFQSFLNRRKIKNIPGWCKSNQIHSLLDLERFCKTESLSIELGDYASLFTVDKDPALEKKTPNKSWHVPAAERPIKKSAKKSVSRKTTNKKTKA